MGHLEPDLASAGHRPHAGQYSQAALAPLAKLMSIELLKRSLFFLHQA